MVIIKLELLFFFFKQKTAYEMRISDWSSDVCSSDLILETRRLRPRISVPVQRAHPASAARRSPVEHCAREAHKARPCLPPSRPPDAVRAGGHNHINDRSRRHSAALQPASALPRWHGPSLDRKRVVEGKRGSVRVDF